MEQKSPEWFAARLGSLGSSRIAEATATIKSGGYGAGRDRVLADLVCEQITGASAEGFKSFAMVQGIEREPAGREAYLRHINKGRFDDEIMIKEIGLVRHPKIAWAHASPDGLVGKDGLLELKCPERHTHYDTLRTEKVPEQYVKQVQWQLTCTGRKWCDFASYNPDWPEPMQLWVRRLHRDPEMIKKLESEATIFVHELLERVAWSCKRYGITPAITLKTRVAA